VNAAAAGLRRLRVARMMPRMPGWVWLLVLCANAVAFAVYGFDKYRARGGHRRVAEAHLLWLLFATGWIGAWIAMRLFRHKTAKVSFRRWAVLWTVINPFWLLVWQEFAR
jgi:uncharacterized membrane protein YsdA (DUF1294 family)